MSKIIFTYFQVITSTSPVGRSRSHECPSYESKDSSPLPDSSTTLLIPGMITIQGRKII